ncbi:ABC transporter ATP-binding protein/permease [Acidimicrobiales bacterium]|nr:ABC transporter ATP-binding protein/permease [bacterium]MDB9845696.1 ABC transporter ATP-binding protein/permease [Acidimicrobiales bacterium]
MHGMHPHMVIGRDKDGVKGKSLDRSTVRRVLAYADRYRAMLLGFVATLLVSSLLSIVPALLVRRIIDDAIPASDRGQVNSLALIMVGLALASGVISLIERFFSARIGENLIFDLRVQLFDHVQRMPIGFFTRTQTGALISRMNNDVIGAQRALTGTLGQVISNVIVLATTLVAMFILEWRLPLLALGLLPFFLLPTKRVGRVLQGLTREQMDHNAAMNTTMTERLNVAGAMVVKLFGRHDDERDGFGARAGAVRDLGIRSAMYGRAFTIGLTVVGALGTAVIYWVGGRLAIGGSISVGTVVAMGLYVTRIYLPLTGLTNARVDIMTAMVSFERVFEVLDTHNPITDAADAVELREPAGRIVADNLAFAYPSDSNAPASLEAGGVSPASSGVENPLVLANINFTIDPGQTIALVGPSGAGKSTLISLLPRLYDVTDGSLSVDGHDVRSLTQASLRSAIGVVSQDPHLFHDSVGANLRYARPDATDDEIRQACRAAQILDVIDALPDGLDTVVGERGYRLSGGEKQRLSIARMLLKDPAVVVLDEATSHLDSENESLVQQALATALDGRTAIVIAHRLSTITAADMILVLEHGQIVERGSHTELLHSGGLYSELYQTLIRGEASPA